jgi:ABC-type amino acid transport substrate-binding protein
MTRIPRCFGVLSAVVLIALVASYDLAPGQAKYRLVTPRTLTLATSDGFPPWMSLDANKEIVGTDADVIKEIAKELGLKLQPQVMEWSGAIQAVLSGRADLAGGGMAWSEERSKTLAMTDAIGWQPMDLTQRKSSNLTKLEDFKGGKTIGTIIGFSYVNVLKAVPWIGENLKLYPTADAAVLDLQAGRVDALVLAANYGIYLSKQRPDLDLKVVVIEPTPLIPEYMRRGRGTFAAAKDNQALIDAMNVVIKRMWADGRMKKIFEKYDQTDKAFIEP